MDSSSIHGALIVLHSITATIAFFAGCLLIYSRTYATNQVIFRIFLWSLIGMAVLLAGAIFVYWQEYTAVEQIIFPGLLGLSLFMVFRGWGAGLVLGARQKNWKPGYIEHLGFTLISLFEGFIIVSGLNSGFPGWLVGLVAILGLFAGRWGIGWLKHRNA